MAEIELDSQQAAAPPLQASKEKEQGNSHTETEVKPAVKVQRSSDVCENQVCGYTS